MDNIKKKVISFFATYKNKIIKGSKGMVSIFLACLLVPFAYIADLLVESGRYGASMALGDQAVASAEMSTLAHYDEYLLERFQLMAISQKEDLRTVFSDYAQANFDGFSSNLGIMSMDVDGLFPLTSDTVLMRQVLEASKYSVPAHFSGVSLSTILSKLEGMSNLDGMSQLLSAVKKETDAYVNFTKEFEKLTALSDDVNSKKSTYDTKFNEFKAAVAEAVKKLKAYNKAKAAEEAAKKAYDAAKSAYNSALSAYNSAQSQLSSASSALSSAQSAADNAASNLSDAKKSESNAKKAMEDAKDTMKDKEKALEELEKSATATVEDINRAIDDYNNAVDNYEYAKSVYESAKSNTDSVESASSSASANLSAAKSDYNSAKSKMDSASSKLDSTKSKMQSAENKYNKAVAATKAAKKAYDAAINKAEAARKAYLKAIDNLRKSVNKYKTQVDKSITERNDIVTEATRVANVANSTTNGNLNAGSISSGINSGKNDIVSSTQSVLKNSNVTALQQTYTKLNSLYTSISNFKTKNIKTNTVIDKNNEAYYVKVNGVSSKSTINTAIKTIKTKVDASVGKLWDKMNAIFTILDSVATVGGVYDKRLTAVVNSGTSYSAGEVDNLIKGLANMVNTYDTLLDSTSGLSNVNYFKKISSLLGSSVSFMSSLSSYLGGVLARINEALSQLSSTSLDDKFVLSQYLMMSLPDRSNFDTGSNKITGLKFSDAALKPTSGSAAGSYGAFKDVINLYNTYASASGSDIVFSGAELEYILMGSRSEVMNQMGTFFQIYFMRMMFDITPIMTNSFVKSIAKAAGQSSYGLGEILVYVSYLIVEPYIDTTVLISGGCVPLSGKSPWMTTSGLPKLMGDMVKASIGSGAKNKIISAGKTLTNNAYKGSVGSASSSSSATKGFNLNFGYSNYVFYLVILFNEYDQTMDRFESIINMEGTQYYRSKGYSFNKGKTYTYISAHVETSFTSFLPLDPMAGGGGFNSISCKQTRGY